MPDDDPFLKILFVVVLGALLLIGWMNCQPPPCLEYVVDPDGAMDCHGNEFYMRCTPVRTCIRRAEER